MIKTNQRPPHIAVLVDTATGWGRRLIRGVTNYARINGPWNLLVEPKGPGERLRLPRGWDGDGVIARVSSTHLAKHLNSWHRDIPIINVSGIDIESCDFPVVRSHLQSRVTSGLGTLSRSRSLAICILWPQIFLTRRDFAKLFHDCVREKGFSFRQFEHPRAWASMGWEQQQDHLSDWLTSLPKPCAVPALGRRIHGVQLINSCHDANIQVPSQIAVLGGDEDELMCNSCFPELSGTEVPSEQIGFEAAKQLHQLLCGAKHSSHD